LTGLHADICVLQIEIGAVQAERIYIFVQWKFVWEKIKTIPHTLHAQLESGITR